jgi:hypothetical protein
MTRFFFHENDKRARFAPDIRMKIEPKLTITKRITGTWGVDVRFFDHFPHAGDLAEDRTKTSRQRIF